MRHTDRSKLAIANGGFMRLTQFTDYGLRVLMRLAGAPAQTMTTEILSSEFGISRHHLVKVVAALAAAGFIETQRGAGGGIRLARPAARIRLGDVVREMEGDQALVECFRADGGACVLTPSCRLKGRLAEARQAFVAALNRSTLADCAVEPRLVLEELR